MNPIQTAMILGALPMIYCVFSIIFLGMIMYQNKCQDNTGRMTNGFFFFFMLLVTCQLAIFGNQVNEYIKEKRRQDNENTYQGNLLGSLIVVALTSLICILSVYYANNYCRDTLLWTVITFPVIIFLIAYFLFVRLSHFLK
tara:strand:- start:946 stop:1368 length:423 start_codon:yes stop_codon:yes gene_type:complete